MFMIRVDPDVLRGSSHTMQGIGQEASAIGGELLNTTQRAPSYDGQFGPQVTAIGAEANARLGTFGDRLGNLGMRLALKANEFQNVDNASFSGVNSVEWEKLFSEGMTLLGQTSTAYLSGLYLLNRFLLLGSLMSMRYMLGNMLVPSMALLLVTGQRVWTHSIFYNYRTKLPEYINGQWNLWFIGKDKKLWPQRQGRPLGNERKLELNIPAWKDEVKQFKTTGDTKLGGVRLGGKGQVDLLEGEAGFGIRVGKGKADIGGYAKVTGATAGASGVVGDKNFGVGAGVKGTAVEGEIFAGLQKGRAGFNIGGKLVSAEGTVGLNVKGVNVGVMGEIGVKFEVGLEVGKKTRIRLGPFTIGLNIDEALGS